MRKFLVVFSVFFTLFVGAVQAIDFKENVHYKVIGDKPTNKPEIIEFFSFYCGSCYQFSPFSEGLEKAYPKVFKSYQVNFIAPQNMVDTIVQSWATAQVLKVGPDFKKQLFHQHFVENKQSNSIQDIQKAFQKVGVTTAQFEQAYASLAAKTLTNRMKRTTIDYDISSTPTYIVNGKYQIIQQGFRNSGNQFFEHLNELVEYLLEKDS